MSEARIAQKEPYAVELEPGTYYWCACGRSQNQPFCDGSHQVTNLQPLVFKIDEKKMVYLCGCKQTGGKPFCDGTHKNI
ncbi:MAG: CDGSH iron-sulfur domain-containing protein [Acidiferrobacterales bacterium]